MMQEVLFWGVWVPLTVLAGILGTLLLIVFLIAFIPVGLVVLAMLLLASCVPQVRLTIHHTRRKD